MSIKALEASSAFMALLAVTTITAITATMAPTAFAQESAPTKNTKAGESIGLKKSITWEKIQDNPAPLHIRGKIEPRHSDLSRPSWWSIGCETLDRDYSVFENYKQFVGQTGAGYARLQSGWARTEKEKGKYDFAWLDAQVDGLLEQGLHPWISLSYGNPIYTDGGTDLNAGIFGEGKVMQAWEKYVAAVVKHYKGKVEMYEVWNEPDGGGRNKEYEKYVVLFDHTSRAIRKADPSAKIAGFAVCNPNAIGRNGVDYIMESVKIMKKRGCLDNLDYITFHGYWDIPDLIAPT